MKRIVLSLAVVATTFAYGQKKEIAVAYKAIDAGDVSTAKAQVAAAEAIFGNKTYLLEPEVLEQYYYAKGLGLLKSGNAAEGAIYLAKISDLGKNKIYTGKDSSKTRVYYVGKVAADASGITGLKEENYVPATISKLTQALDPMVQSANKAAIDAYNAKNYLVAAPKFREVYDLLKASGVDNKQSLYYSAINYALGEKKAEAGKIFQELIDAGYTGAETTYTAKDKSGNVENMSQSTWETYKKLGAASGFTDFKTETSKSIEPELFEQGAGLLIEAGLTDDALAFIEKGLKKYPNNNTLLDLRGTAYYKAGKTDAFIKSLKDQVAQNPNSKDAWYNLAVLQSKDPATHAEAEASYKKAIEIDPKFVLAHQNLTYLVMGDDAKAIEDYQALRKAGKLDEANKILDARRVRFAKALPYAEKWYAVDSENIDVVTMLKSFYGSVKNEAKAKEFKAIEDALKAKK